MTPADPLSAPSVTQYYHADGRLKYTETRCTANCPPGFGNTIRSYTNYGPDGQALKLVRELAPFNPGAYARTCIEYDDTFPQLVKAVRGAACRLDATGQVLDEIDSNADCDRHGQDVTCPSDVLEWESVPAPPAPSELGPEALIYRLKSITPASEEGTGKKLRFVYHPRDPNDASDADDALHYTCHPEWTGPPDATGAECTEVRYERRTDSGFDILRVLSVSDGTWTAAVPNTWSFTYGADNLPAAVQDPEGYVTKVAFNPAGFAQTVESSDSPTNLITSWTWTPRGQVETVTSPNDQGATATTGFNYSPAGKLRKVTDVKRGVAWWTVYWADSGLQYQLRRGETAFLAAEVLPSAIALPEESGARRYGEWHYNDNGDLLHSVADQTLTQAGCPAPQVPVLVPMVTIARDGYGNVRSVDDLSTPYIDQCYTVHPFDGNVVSAGFGLDLDDGLGNPATCDGATTEATETFAWTVDGRLKRTAFSWAPGSGLAGGTASLCLEYDAARRLQSASADVVGVTGTGEPCPDVPPLAQLRRYTWDASQRMTGMEVHHAGAQSGNYLFAHDGSGRLLTSYETLGSAQLAYAYRRNGQVRSIQRWPGTAGPPGPPISREYLLGYDAAGRLNSVLDHQILPKADLATATLTEYQHDRLSRLSRAWTAPAKAIPGTQRVYDLTYEYAPTDDWNIARIVDAGSFRPRDDSYTFDLHDQVQTINGAPAGMVYDERGRLLCDGERQLTWDALGRLVKGERGGAGTTYAYDPSNRLVASRSTSGGQATIHLWDGWMQLGEFVDGGGNAQPAITYASGPTGLMGAYKTTSGYTRFAHDHQGSRKDALADTPGYDPYGRALALPPNDAPDPPLAFQGHEWRKELGLYYARNRWYDPTRGAFVSVDPITQSRVNNYEFGRGNPVLWGDPLGLYPSWLGGPVQDAYYKALPDGEDAARQAATTRTFELLKACGPQGTRAFLGGAPSPIYWPDVQTLWHQGLHLRPGQRLPGTEPGATPVTEPTSLIGAATFAQTGYISAGVRSFTPLTGDDWIDPLVNTIIHESLHNFFPDIPDIGGPADSILALTSALFAEVDASPGCSK